MNGPVVQIAIAATADRELVVLKATRTGRSLTLELPPGKLNKARDTVNRTLRRFKDNVGSSLGPRPRMPSTPCATCSCGPP
jgi:hypothetical protein